MVLEVHCLFQQMILQVWAPCNNTCYMYLDKFDGGGVKSDKEFKQQNMQKEIKKTIPVKISNVKNPSSKLAETLWFTRKFVADSSL